MIQRLYGQCIYSLWDVFSKKNVYKNEHVNIIHVDMFIVNWYGPKLCAV